MINTAMKTRGRPAKLIMDEKFMELYENSSNAEIAKEYNVTISAVQKMARRNELRKNDGGRPSSMPDAAELTLLCANHTDKEVAELHKVCPGTVAYWRKKLGITKYHKDDVMKIA